MELQHSSISVAAQTILKLFEYTNSIFEEVRNPLDVLMKDDILTKLYTAVGFGQYAEIVKLLANKKPWTTGIGSWRGHRRYFRENAESNDFSIFTPHLLYKRLWDIYVIYSNLLVE